MPACLPGTAISERQRLEEEDTVVSYEEEDTCVGPRFLRVRDLRRRIHVCHMRRRIHVWDRDL